MAQTISIIDVGLWLILGLGGWSVYQAFAGKTKKAYGAQVSYYNPSNGFAPPGSWKPPGWTMPTAPVAASPTNVAPAWTPPTPAWTPPATWGNWTSPVVMPTMPAGFPPLPTFPWTNETFHAWLQQVIAIAKSRGPQSGGPI